MSKAVVRVKANDAVGASARPMGIRDGLESMVNNLGNPMRDKSSGVTWSFSQYDWRLYVAAFQSSWLARQLCKVPAEDMTRQWRTWNTDTNTQKLLRAEETRHNLIHKVRLATTWARAAGGAAIVINDGSASASEPIDLESVGRKGLRSLQVVARSELEPTDQSDIIEDDTDPHYLLPQFWDFNSARTRITTPRIHHSRIVFITGEERMPMEANALLDYWWGESALVTPLEAIQHAHMASSSAAALIQEATVDVINIKGLEQISNQQSEANLTKRLMLTQQLKGVLSILALAEGEQFTRHPANFGGLRDTVSELMSIAAAAADIPATRLLGRAPQGMNATGESDLTNYFQMVEAWQKTNLQPQLAPQLDRLIVRSALGNEPDDLDYDWNPLDVNSAETNATVLKTEAEAAQILIQSGAVRSEVMTRAMESHVATRGHITGFRSAIDETGELTDEDFEEDEAEMDAIAGEQGELDLENPNADDPE